MKYLFKTLTLFLAIFGCVTLIAQTTEVSPNLSRPVYDPNQKAIWDFLLGFDVTALSGAAGNAGAEWDGTYFYSTRWASNFIHKYNSAGTTLMEQFSIPSVSGLRDLAFDGTYMYGGAAGNTIYQMDFVSKTLIGTIWSPVAVRFIAYDEANDGFWVGNWGDPLTLVSRTGATLATIATPLTNKYGAAYDNVSPGGPYLWVFDQGSGAGTPQLIHQYHIPSGTATGVTHDVTTEFPTAVGIAGGLFTMSDFASGLFTLGGLLQGTPDNIFVYEIAPTVPCPVGLPSNPNPPNGAINIPLTGNTATWTNGTGTIDVELWFGPAGNVDKVYDGPAITSFALTILSYNTLYQWYIVCKNDTCETQGPIWTFTTIQDPNLFGFCDEFDNLNNWTLIGPLGTTNWSAAASSFAGGTAPELMMNWSPTFIGESKIRSSVFSLISNQWYAFSFNFFFDWYADPSGVVTVGITYDGGTTSTILYTLTNPSGNIGPTIINASLHTPSSGAENCQLEITYIGNSFNTDNIYWDNLCLVSFIPVELEKFICTVDNNTVTLFWQTATETNNQGFEIERARLRSSNYAEASWERIGLVEGMGTTTEIHTYSFTDKPEPGTYKYRLKQIDFDGSFAYSPEVEVEVKAPNVFSLEQNYPNPFNPNTVISYQLPVTGNISLKVYDILGNEVATLVNEEQTAGVYEIEFNVAQSATGGSRPEITSGIYFYQLKAGSFIETKKMILIK